MKLSIPSVGVEEEYQLVDPESGRLIPNCKQVMRQLGQATGADIQHELHLNQIEMASSVCHTLEEVKDSVVGVRRQLIAAAEKTGAALAAAGTNPLELPETDTLTPKKRYRKMRQRYQQIARDLFIFGCHVHVSMDDKTLGLQVMNRCRRYLPALQALTANSPFWDGVDTGYASYRRELWAQWPMAGPPPHFESVEAYESCIKNLIQCGAIQDESFIYWDIRLSTKVPTIEFRAADVMMSVEETVGYVGLVRALVMKATEDIAAGETTQHVDDKVLSYAIWHAARYGVRNELIDPLSCQRFAASDVLHDLTESIQTALDRSGDRQIVETYLDTVLRNGTGADRQRSAVSDSHDLVLAVRHAIEETRCGTSQP